MSVERIITENLDIWTSASKTKSASGRGSSKRLELYGIKKLRELILELAIRGKLIPNDYDDFSLKEHLTHLNAARLNLIESGALKKTKKQLPVSVDEQLFEIPTNWMWLRLSDVYDVRDGTHDSPKPVESGYPLVTSKNLSSGKLDLSDVKYISEIDHKKIIERSKVDFGDILFAMIGSIGNPVVVDQTVEFSIKNVALFKYFDYEQSCPEYLKYYLVFASKVFKEQSSGGVQPFVSLGKLRAFTIPYPPLNEQIKIAEKLNDLMALCDQLESQTETSIETHQTLVKSLLETLTNAKDADELNESWQRISAYFDVLFTTEDSIDQLKQTILQLAVMGRLVKQDPNDEPACKLLEKLATEKKRLIVAKEAKDSGKVHAKAPINEAFAIPDNWLWVRFRELIWCYRGHNPPKSEFSETPKQGYVRFVQITDFKTDKSAVYVPQSPKNKLVKKGEIIMAAYRHIGKLSRKMEGAFNVALCKIMPFTPMNVDFVELMIGTDVVKGELLRASERGHIPSMHSDHLLSLLVPLPPLAEQRRIVAKVDELMTLCETLKNKLRVSQEVQLDISDAFAKQAS